jgi:uncharacterized RDD family membrane protein YckC
MNPYEAPKYSDKAPKYSDKAPKKYSDKAPKLDATTETAKGDLTDKLASRWLRLWGALLDALFEISTSWLLYQLGFYGYISWLLYLLGFYDYILSEQIMLTIIGISAFLVVNGVLIYKRGQTIGKLICKTKVVTLDGKQVSGNRYLFLRIFPLWIIYQIPIIGGIFAIIDALLIFRKEKNCLHDDIAQTRVIKI